MPKVMIVEDVVELRELYAECLQSAGYEVIQCENGIEALKLFPDVKPALLITDIQMPIMNGVELIEAINNQTPEWETKTVIMTGGLNQSITILVQKAYDLGARAFLSKPFELDELANLAKSLVEI